MGAAYEHQHLLAPTQDILDAYKKRKGDWAAYETEFLALMERRRIHDVLSRASFQRRTALLCSESGPEHCHRRLVVEFLAQQWPDVKIVRL